MYRAPVLDPGGEIRYAAQVGSSGKDELDGGPPIESRYITANTDPLKLPSMELEHLIFEFDAYRQYLDGVLS